MKWKEEQETHPAYVLHMLSCAGGHWVHHAQAIDFEDLRESVTDFACFRLFELEKPYTEYEDRTETYRTTNHSERLAGLARKWM
jgi:hypothetical protein